MYTIQEMSANDNPSPDAMLDSVAALIREFLVCDDHQLTVLTLWVLHTWCYMVCPTTPYLHIHSPKPIQRSNHHARLHGKPAVGRLDQASKASRADPPAFQDLQPLPALTYSRRDIQRLPICDFKDAWERYLPALSPTLLRRIAESTFRPVGVGPLGDNQHPPDNHHLDVTAVTGA